MRLFVIFLLNIFFTACFTKHPEENTNDKLDFVQTLMVTDSCLHNLEFQRQGGVSLASLDII